jgi:hypothetical protein
MRHPDTDVAGEVNDPKSLSGEKFLAVMAGVAFLVGLYFPILVLLDPGPSAMVYGLVLVSALNVVAILVCLVWNPPGIS